MKKNYIAHKDGVVLLSMFCEEEIALLQKPEGAELSEIELFLNDPHSVYIDEGEMCLRPSLNVEVSKYSIESDETDISVLSNIPEDAIVYVNGQLIEHDGSLEISATEPMVFDINIIPAFPYKELLLKIEAV